MKKVLIIGGSHRDIPLIKAYQELGYFTITVGNLEYYIGYKYSDQNFPIDFTNEELLKQLIRKESIDYVVPGSGELPMMIAARLSKDSFFDSKDVLETLHTKNLFKTLCQKIGVHVPLGITSSSKNILQQIPFPVIVKPLNLSGGKGISVAHNDSQLEHAIIQAQKESNEKNVLIEEFIKSDLFAYSVIFKNQKIIYSFLAQEIEKNYYVTTTFGVTLNPSLIKNLNSDLHKIAKELNLKDGLLHVQFMVKNNLAHLLEVTRRIPGDLFPNMIDMSDGVDYSKAVALSYLGKTKNLESLLHLTKDFNLLRYCVVAKNNGIFEEIIIDDSIEVFEKIIIYSSKDFIKANTLIGIVIIKFQQNILDKLDQLIYIKEENK